MSNTITISDLVRFSNERPSVVGLSESSTTHVLSAYSSYSNDWNTSNKGSKEEHPVYPDGQKGSDSCVEESFVGRGVL